MEDNSGGLRRAVLYTLSEDSVSVAFALLGHPRRRPRPFRARRRVLRWSKGTALKAASAVPGMGALKAVDAARKVAESGSSGKPKVTGKKPQESGRMDSSSAKDAAVRVTSAAPGMGASTAVDAARKVEERPVHFDRTASAPAAPRSVPGGALGHPNDKATVAHGRHAFSAVFARKADDGAPLPPPSPIPVTPFCQASPEARLGFGAKAEAGVEVTDDRRVRFKAKAGAASGIGGSLGIEVEWTKRRSKTSCSAVERQEWR
jgi:hypothetical protein